MTTYFKKDMPKYKKKKRGLPPAERDKVYKDVFARDRKCQNPFCKSGSPLDNPHHVVKKSQYGKDTPENLVLLCCSCHRLIHHSGRLKVTGEYPDFVFTEL